MDSVILEPTPALFPRIEEKLLQDSNMDLKLESKMQNKESKSTKLEPLEISSPISKDDFMKIDIRIGTIINAEVLPKSEKLLKLQVDLGEARPRQILAGIKAHYLPQDLLGKQVCVLANLKPAKLMGN